MSITLRAVISGLFFLFIFLSGFWLSLVGKPYHAAILNVHKLIGLAAGAFLGILVYQTNRTAPLGPVEIAALAITILFVVATVVMGGLASIATPMPAIVLTMHRLSPYVTLLSTAVTLYLLLRRG